MSELQGAAPARLIHLVDTPAPPSLLALDFLNPYPNGIFHSLPAENDQTKMLVVNSIMGDSFALADTINQEIKVQDVLVHPAETPDEATGGVQRWTRVVLFGPDGTPIACGSVGVLKSLVVYASQYGRPPWHPPAVFKVRSKNLKGAKRWTWLEVPYAPVSGK